MGTALQAEGRAKHSPYKLSERQKGGQLLEEVGAGEFSTRGGASQTLWGSWWV